MPRWRPGVAGPSGSVGAAADAGDSRQLVGDRDQRCAFRHRIFRRQNSRLRSGLEHFTHFHPGAGGGAAGVSCDGGAIALGATGGNGGRWLDSLRGPWGQNCSPGCGDRFSRTFLQRGIEFGEDGLAIFLTWFATRHPYSAAAIVVCLLVIIVLLARWVLRAFVRFSGGRKRCWPGTSRAGFREIKDL